MAAPRKFDRETRERAGRMYQDRLAESHDSKLAARRYVGELLGINQATLRNWIEDRHFTTRPAVTDGGVGPASEALLHKANGLWHRRIATLNASGDAHVQTLTRRCPRGQRAFAEWS